MANNPPPPSVETRRRPTPAIILMLGGTAETWNAMDMEEESQFLNQTATITRVETMLRAYHPSNTGTPNGESGTSNFRGRIEARSHVVGVLMMPPPFLLTRL
jgi:hypothetical protein